MHPEPLRVLLLDRDPTRRERLRRTLESEAWLPMVITPVEKAVEIVSTTEPCYDVALLALSPVEDVLAVARALAAHLPCVPIVAIGGELRDTDPLSMIRCGVQDHIPLKCVTCEGSSRLRSSLGWAVDRSRVSRRLERMQRESAHRALHDPLTALPTRELLRNRLCHLLARAARRDTPFAVMFVDLDRFKQVNDTFGHDVGDSLLVEVARRLSSSLRESDTCARWGGDEFMVILEGVLDREDASRVARKILTAVGRPLCAGGRDLVCTASIGISLYPGGGTDEETLVRHADLAMYRAKFAGGNGYHFFR